MTTMRFAVIGDPIAHSKSPVMHAAAYRSLGLAHTYEALHVPDALLKPTVDRLRAGEFDGFNVTIPHKQRVLSMVDAIDTSALLAGAANTLARSRDGRITAYNTDVAALAHELTELGMVGRQCALVLGSGGAARAAIVALAVHLKFACVVVRARAFELDERAEHFRADMKRLLSLASCKCAVEVEPLEPRREAFDAVVQCTSVGMSRDDADVAVAIDWDSLAIGAVALDVVYTKAETEFVRAAARASVPVVNGAGLLVEQGALAFQLWLGVEPPRNVMRQAIGDV